MTVVVGPPLDLATGVTVGAGTAAATNPGQGVVIPPIQKIEATTENIQAVVVDTFEEGAPLGDLIPRIEALESETDGLVAGADALTYYILAKGT